MRGQQEVETQMHADKKGCTQMAIGALSACIRLICVHLRLALLA